MKNKQEIKDCTKDGKCSGCGGCCTAFLPLTKNEVEEIRKYVKKHNINQIERQTLIGYNMMCMFLDQKTKRCKIYPVRPYVCKDFICNNKNWRKKRDEYAERAYYNKVNKNGLPINMTTFDDLLFDDPRPLLVYLIDYIKTNCPDPNKETEMMLQILRKVGRQDIAEHIEFS